MEKRYYVVVELRDYDDKVIGSSSCTCESDISNESVITSARIAGELLVKYNLTVQEEQRSAWSKLFSEL